LVAINPMIGFLNAIPTIMMLNICRELPDMYIMMAVIGNCLTGARATSHAFLSFNVSISVAVRGARTAALEEPCCFCASISTTQFKEVREATLLPVDVNPGGSGIPLDFGFAAGGELRSITHCGGGGGAAISEIYSRDRD
jgi:hypothetical protein